MGRTRPLGPPVVIVRIGSVRRTADSVTVSSEPFGDDAEWTPVPDRHLVVADTTDVRIEPLPEGEHP